MLKTSVIFKATMFAVLIALVLASLPTASVFAVGNNEDLEGKWEQLVTNFDTQSSTHDSAHKWVGRWLDENKNASVSEKAEIQKHLTICNSAITAAGAIVSKHAGFDAQGKVIERASALKSIKDLANFLRQHAGSVQNLKEHMKN
jgi:hypothetical protein